MFDRETKTFRNTATTPIQVTVAACVDDRGFVRDIAYAGGTLCLGDDLKAERERMSRWIRTTFVGQSERFFLAHNGVVPDRSPKSASDVPYSSQRTQLLLEQVYAHVPIGSKWQHTHDRRDRTWEIVKVEPLKSKLRFSVKDQNGRHQYLTYRNVVSFMRSHTRVRDIVMPVGRLTFPHVLRAPCRHSFVKPQATQKTVNVTPPACGSFWRRRDTTSYYRVVSWMVHSDESVTVTMVKIGGLIEGKIEAPFATVDAWTQDYEPVDAYEATRGALYATDIETYNPRVVGMPPELGAGFRMGAKSDEVAAEQGRWLHDEYLKAYPHMQTMLDAVPFNGKELPPKEGELYSSLVNNHVYRVTNVATRMHKAGAVITLQRICDGAKVKQSFTTHARWLSVWRPAADEGKARPVVRVDLQVDTKQVSSSLAALAGAAQQVKKSVRDWAESNEARQPRVLYRELDKRVPGWRESETPNAGAFVDEVGLAQRAIRKLFNQRDNASADLQRTRREAAEMRDMLARQIENKNHDISRLSEELGMLRARIEQAGDDEAVYALVRIVDELHKKVPDWKTNPHGPSLGETECIIRTIRRLVKSIQDARETAQAQGAQISELLKARDHFQEQKVRDDARAASQVFEVTADLTRIFKRVFGINPARQMLATFGSGRSIRDLTPDELVKLAEMLRLYAERQDQG
jgi:predicted  nucleic acid-binding Zn-ribbon protein